MPLDGKGREMRIGDALRRLPGKTFEWVGDPTPTERIAQFAENGNPITERGAYAAETVESYEPKEPPPAREATSRFRRRVKEKLTRFKE